MLAIEEDLIDPALISFAKPLTAAFDLLFADRYLAFPPAPHHIFSAVPLHYLLRVCERYWRPGCREVGSRCPRVNATNFLRLRPQS
jgi:hypothetical protein